MKRAVLLLVLSVGSAAGCGAIRDETHAGFSISYTRPPILNVRTPVLVDECGRSFGAHQMGTMAAPSFAPSVNRLEFAPPALNFTAPPATYSAPPCPPPVVARSAPLAAPMTCEQLLDEFVRNIQAYKASQQAPVMPYARTPPGTTEERR